MGAKLDSKELKKQALKAAQEHNLYFVRHVCAYIGIATSTFYSYFPSGSSAYKEIEALLMKNRTETLTSQLTDWKKSEHPTLQLALAKVIGDDEIRRRLSYNYQDGPPQPGVTVNVLQASELPMELLAALKQQYIEKRKDPNQENRIIDVDFDEFSEYDDISQPE